MRIRLFLVPAFLATLALGPVTPPSDAEDSQPVASVRGNGLYVSDLEGDWRGQVSINAWLDSDGTAHGMVVWTAVDYSDSGPGSSGYPWYMVVTGIVIEGNHAVVEAIVVYSPQVPEDEGSLWPFFIIDNGSGTNDPPDELGIGFPPNLQPLEVGGFTVRSAD